MNKYNHYLPATTPGDEPTPTASAEVAQPVYPARPDGPEDLGRRDAERRGSTLRSPARRGAKDGPGEETSSRHQRKCSVCRHPDRDAIEEAFLHWQSPNQIAAEYDLSDEVSIYRHAHATGLFARRDNNLRFALGNFIERVNEIQVVTPGAIVRAIRAYTRISKTGEWVEPPRQIIVTHVKAPEDTFTPSPPQAGQGHAKVLEVAGHVKAAELPACDPDITQITTPKALPPRLKRIGNGGGKRA